MLLSGCDNHQAGMGVMQPLHAMNQYMQPGYEGYLNHSVPTMAELLRDAGYHTYLSGKWHVGITDDTRPAARGFDRSFAFLGGGASHELADDFYTSTHFADRLIGYLREQDNDRPFLGYLSFTAPHDPLHVPDADLDTYAGRYVAGYDEIKRERMARMKELGLIGRRRLRPVPVRRATSVRGCRKVGHDVAGQLVDDLTDRSSARPEPQLDVVHPDPLQVSQMLDQMSVSEAETERDR